MTDNKDAVDLDGLVGALRREHERNWPFMGQTLHRRAVDAILAQRERADELAAAIVNIENAYIDWDTDSLPSFDQYKALRAARTKAILLARRHMNGGDDG